MSIHYRRDTCRLCESKKVEKVVPLEPIPIADNFVTEAELNVKQDLYPTDIYLCLECGHVQLLDVIDPTVLFRNTLYVTSSSLGLVDHFRRYAQQIKEQFTFSGTPQVIEIGSNEGVLLRAFKDLGFKVLGVDAAQKQAKAATAAGLETLAEFFTLDLARRIRKERGPAAILAANNVFAHNDDLATMANGAEHLLQDDGVFVFEVGYLVDFVEGKLFDTVYHEHLGYHSVKPLAIFLERHGLELISVTRIPTKAGSIRGVAQRRGGPRKKDASVAEILALEKKMGLDRPETFKALAAGLEKTREDLRVLMARLSKEGKRVVGYGASPGCTTMLYYFGLQKSLAYIVDDNPIKHGRFSPAAHIPVMASDKLMKDRPDYVFVLAWIYAKPILARHAGFSGQGGKFIVPLPELVVV